MTDPPDEWTSAWDGHEWAGGTDRHETRSPSSRGTSARAPTWGLRRIPGTEGWGDTCPHPSALAAITRPAWPYLTTTFFGLARFFFVKTFP